MPTQDTVTIKVDIDVKDLAASEAKLKAFFNTLDKGGRQSDRELTKVDKRLAKIDKTSNKTQRSITKTSKAFDKFKDILKKTGQAAGKFFAMFTKFSFIGVAIEIALVSAALLGVKLALVSGRLVMQAYRSSLVGLGVAAQGVAVALGSVAAAMRQINEVTLAPNIGGAARSAQALRSAMNDQMLSFYGMEGVQNAVNSLAKGGVTSDQGYTKILRQLGDYTADPKELADLASIYATVSKSGSIDSGSLEAMGKINPALAAGVSELSGLSGAELEKALGDEGAGIGSDVMNALLAGTAEATDAWEGQLGRLNNTVVGTLKGMVPRMFQLFADLGEPFLDSIQQMLSSVEQIITETVMRIRGAVISFGLDSMIPGILSGFEKLADLFVRITISAGGVEGWMTTIGRWWDTIKNYFIDMQRIFESLEPAADALIDILGPQFKAIWDGSAKLIRNFGDILIENKDEFMEFSEALGNIFSGIIGLFGDANSKFSDALPVWTDFANMIADDLLPTLGDIFDMLHEASQNILPAVTAAFSAMASVLSSVATSLTAIMKIPGIGLLLSAMMFKSTRGLVKGAASLVGGAVGPSVRGGGLAMRTTFGQLQQQGLGETWNRRGRVGGALGGRAAMGAAPMSGAALAGMTLAPALAGGLAGNWLGGMAGSNFAGGAGQAAGAGAGALVGAGAGALIGTAFAGPLGTAVGGAIGGIVGGITGYMSAKGAQDAEKSGEDAAERLIDAYLDALDRGLEKGQNREILTGILTQFDADTKAIQDQIMSGEESFATRQARSYATYLERLEARKGIEDEVSAKTETLNGKLHLLSSATGTAWEELEHMANVMGVDLTDSIGKVLDKAIALGAISEYDLSVEGIRDNSNRLLNDRMFGEGSQFEKDFVGPEHQNTLNALINEGLDSGLTGDLVQGIIENLIAVDQIEHGMEGSDLMAGVLADLPRLDALFGGDTFTRLAPDVEAAIRDMNDPAKNPALQGLLLANMDVVEKEQPTLDPESVTKLATTMTEETMRAINQLDIEDRDEALAFEILAARQESELLSWQNLDEASATLATKFGYLGEQIDWILAGREGPGPSSPVPVSQPAPAPTFTGSPGPSSPALTDRGRHGGASTVVKPVQNTSVTASSRSSTNISINATGMGTKEAVTEITRQVQRAVRNYNQRSTPTRVHIGNGGFIE